MDKYFVKVPYFVEHCDFLNTLEFSDLNIGAEFSNSISTLVRDNTVSHAKLKDESAIFSPVLVSYDEKKEIVYYYCEDRKEGKSVVLCEFYADCKDGKFIDDFSKITGIEPTYI